MNTFAQLDPLTLILLVIILVSLFQVVVTYFTRRKEKPEPQFIYKKVVECTSTSEKKVEDFQVGDFVGKIVGVCNNNGKLVIRAIYAEPIQHREAPGRR